MALRLFLLQTHRPRVAARIWVTVPILYGTFTLVVTAVSSAEQTTAVIEKFATESSMTYASGLVLFLTAANVYSQPIALRTRLMSIAGHLALRTLQGPIIYTRVGPEWAWKWLRYSWASIVFWPMLGGWFAAALFWRSRASRALACAVHADSLDERYVAKSARRIKLPNSMLQAMVDNLKAEVYEMRLRLMAKGVGESDSSGQSSGGDTHREEELHEGDIRGSFAEGA